jgi:hypothetical protein
MMVDNSRAVSPQTMLGNIAWAGSWPGVGIDGEVETLSDLSTATGAGRIADLITLVADGSGTQRFYIIQYKNDNERAIALLERWIDQYGDDRDPDLEDQIDQLNNNRLSLHERC